MTEDTEHTDCVFCKIIAGRIPCYKIFESSELLAFLDIGPISEGHTIVIPRSHYQRLDQCPPAILAEVTAATGFIAKAVIAAVNAPAYNVLCNNGSQAGQVVKHLHFHIIPRKDGDGLFTQWPASKYPQGKAEDILRKIKEKIHI